MITLTVTEKQFCEGGFDLGFVRNLSATDGERHSHQFSTQISGGNASGHEITQSLYNFLVKTGGITRQTSLYKCRLTIVSLEEVVSPGQREELEGKNLTSLNDAAASAR